MWQASYNGRDTLTPLPFVVMWGIPVGAGPFKPCARRDVLAREICFMFTKHVADLLCQNTTYITTKGRGARVSQPVFRKDTFLGLLNFGDQLIHISLLALQRQHNKEMTHRQTHWTDFIPSTIEKWPLSRWNDPILSWAGHAQFWKFSHFVTIVLHNGISWFQKSGQCSQEVFLPLWHKIGLTRHVGHATKAYINFTLWI